MTKEARLYKEKSISLKTAFAQRDAEIQDTVIKEIFASNPKDQEEIIKVIEGAIHSAAKHWETKTLDDIYGPKKAEKIRKKMKTKNIFP